MRFTDRVRALTVSVAVLRFFGTDLDAQTAVQGPPPVEWTFDDIVRAALAQHPLILAARDRIESARGTRRTAETLSNPVATYWTENGRFPGQASMGLERETSAYFTLPLEPLFQRAPRIRRADADLKGAETSLAAARRHVGLDAAYAFYRVALAQVTLEAAEENRKGLERLVSYNGASRVRIP